MSTRWDDAASDPLADLLAAKKAAEEAEPRPLMHVVDPKTRRCLTCGGKH